MDANLLLDMHKEGKGKWRAKAKDEEPQNELAPTKQVPLGLKIKASSCES